MRDPSLAITPNISQYFQEVISDALRVRQIEATEEAESYLVSLLCDYAHPDEEAGSTFNQPLTLVLHEAINSVGPDRFRKLRGLGDHTLYALGFFGDHIEGKGIAPGYVRTVGSTAYREAAAMLRLKAQKTERASNVLSELAVKFDRFAEVLRDVADGTLACATRDERSVVKLYERWMKTGSARLAEELGARGIVPSRGAGGLN